MCGRVTLTLPNVDDVLQLLDARIAPEDALLYRPRFNAAPTDLHWVLAADRFLKPAIWGFANGAINARSEKGLRGRRAVVVPADGFYEWTGPQKARRPVWFRPRDGRLLYLAGLADVLPDGRVCFVILTTEAAGEVARIHDRMPVLLPREKLGDWLERPDSGLLVPRDCVFATEVSERVNDVRNDDASLLRQPAQLSLL